MKSYDEFVALITAERERRANFKTLLSCVIPRPIAFVSTISKDGIPNLAPFSFFNGVGSNPPAVIFSPCTKADGTSKDTIVNLRAIPECVVNVVPHGIRDAMNQIKNFDTKGITPPLTFAADRHKGTNGVKIYRINVERKVYEPIGNWVMAD